MFNVIQALCTHDVVFREKPACCKTFPSEDKLLPLTPMYPGPENCFVPALQAI